MADLTRGQKRSEVILRAKQAFKTGITATSFIADMKTRGLSYRRTDMLSDWRSVNELERKAEAFKYVRRDYFPTARVMAQVEWEMSHEFMYKLKVQSRLEPGQPLTERFVNITSDTPMTREAVEEQAWEMIQEQSPDKRKMIVGVSAVTAIQRLI